MIKVGITGGIGSGKTLVCNMFKILGVPVFHADVVAKLLLNTSSNIKEELIENFGADIYSFDGSINRKAFGDIIFNNANSLAVANRIIHPYVILEFKNWLEFHKEKEYILHEAAILFESGVDKEMDKVIYVYAPEDIRVSRVISRDKISTEDINARINNQWPFEKVKNRVNYIINNDGKELLIPQIINIQSKLLSNKLTV